MNLEEMLGIKIQEEKKAGLMPPSVLAYIGDAVYEVFVRGYLISNLHVSVNKLHSETIKYVSAKAQFNILKKLFDVLSERELDIVRRGRNVKTGKIPKNALAGEYRHATAFECLVGYLFISGQEERLRDLITIALEKGYHNMNHKEEEA